MRNKLNFDGVSSYREVNTQKYFHILYLNILEYCRIFK